MPQLSRLFQNIGFIVLLVEHAAPPRQIFKRFAAFTGNAQVDRMTTVATLLASNKK
jgi:hypothetical protein